MRWLLLIPVLALAAEAAAETSPQLILERLVEQPHVELLDQREQSVRDHLIALGAMSKIRGVWAPRHSARATGTLSRFTWRVYDGVASAEVLAAVEASVDENFTPELLFSCDGRACGSSAQWANRIFSQRLLYGTATSQQYRAYAVEHGGSAYRLLLYASARSADRQYLHAQLLEIGN